MIPGNFVTVTEVHFGVGEGGSTYILNPGMGGLIIENYYDVGTLLLLVDDNLVEVRTQAVELLNGWN